MQIVNIKITNWRSYYGTQEIEISNGLNLFLGENGEGKTKLFECLRWFLNGSVRDREIEYVNAKSLKELKDKDRVECSLVLILRDEDDYGSLSEITKSFTISKREDGNYDTSMCRYSGIYSNSKGERYELDNPEATLSALFPDQTRAFSIFEGEDQLDILSQTDSIKSLVNMLSDKGKISETLVGVDFIERKSETALENSFKSQKSTHIKLQEIGGEVQRLDKEIVSLEVNLTKYRSNKDNIDSRIQDIEGILSRAKEFGSISSDIRELKEQRTRFSSSIKENFTRSLFDDKWLLIGFDTTLKSVDLLRSQLDLRRRQEEKAHSERIGAEKARKSLQEDLINGVIPFPIGVPGKDRLREMLDDETCKVCGREAKADTAPYNYMKSHYHKLSAPAGPEESSSYDIFKSNFTKELNELYSGFVHIFPSEKAINEDIRDVIELNASHHDRISKINEKIALLENSLASITGLSGVSAQKLEEVISDYSDLNQSRETNDRNIHSLAFKKEQLTLQKQSLLKEKDDLMSRAGTLNPNLTKARDYSKFLKSVFEELRTKQLSEVVNDLEVRTNEAFSKINVDSFTGLLKLNLSIYSKGEFNISVAHVLQNGEKFKGANKSLLTSANIALVLAASSLVKESGYSSYPMILDAPISSFGEKKSINFLNALKDANGQFILLLKDFIQEDGRDLKISDDFKKVSADKVFWLKLKRPFHREDLSTLATEILSIQ